jgi:hypothetical protein
MARYYQVFLAYFLHVLTECTAMIVMRPPKDTRFFILYLIALAIAFSLMAAFIYRSQSQPYGGLSGGRMLIMQARDLEMPLQRVSIYPNGEAYINSKHLYLSTIHQQQIFQLRQRWCTTPPTFLMMPELNTGYQIDISCGFLHTLTVTLQAADLPNALNQWKES